ncbi:MAG TPA: TetR/AcrR family transcriptional regulator [Solirubrobacteraceae bacterium]|nr:TetR/AcrR family transcriptional regulator [Solirubrobacteraceae bacterium]
MEAATEPGSSRSRELPGDKAARIVEAMRASVAVRGIAGSTFDHVANEAGVSRGLLHYYFGTKERLLVEVVRRESDVRIERLEEAIGGATDAEDVLDALVRSFEEWLGDGPAPVMIYEMLTLAQRNDEIAAQLAELGRRTRSHLADALERKQEVGVLSLTTPPELAAMFLFALADGVMVRRLSEPELDIGPLVEQATAAARAVLS